ncbi:unnamed protein product, partial [Ilex paraguariensis]
MKQRKRSFFETISLSQFTGIEENLFYLLSRNRLILTENGIWSVSEKSDVA